MTRMAPLLFLLTLLGGCALSPQHIPIQPKADVEPANIGHNQPVQVIAVDSRDQAAFGTRGGVYQETALLTPENDLKAALEKTVRNGLQTLGYNAYNPPEDATRLEVRLEKLDYLPEEGSVVNAVTLDLKLLAEASRDEVVHTGTYQSKVDHTFPLTPTTKRNQDMINDILSDAIERMLKDPEMQAFLAGSAPDSDNSGNDDTTAEPEES